MYIQLQCEYDDFMYITRELSGLTKPMVTEKLQVQFFSSINIEVRKTNKNYLIIFMSNEEIQTLGLIQKCDELQLIDNSTIWPGIKYWM